MDNQAQLIENLVAIRSEGLTLGKKLWALPDVPDDLRSRLIACYGKLEAFDAMITIEIDELRYGEEEAQ